MTFYSTTDNHREVVYFWLGVLSTSISSLLLLFDNDSIHKIIVPSGFLIYGITILLVDKWLWRTWLLNWFISIPDLNGDWIGINEKTDKTTSSITVKITQTWRKIDIEWKSTLAMSNAVSASLNNENINSQFFRYIYIAKPIKVSLNGEIRGEGCVELRIKSLDDNTVILEGVYFSSKFRGGHFSLTRSLKNKS